MDKKRDKWWEFVNNLTTTATLPKVSFTKQINMACNCSCLSECRKLTNCKKYIP